jgi:NNP family nitrate/nitrite transporter-like MFS transporter
LVTPKPSAKDSFGFAIFYALCLILNWWFYLRKDAYVKNP